MKRINILKSALFTFTLTAVALTTHAESILQGLQSISGTGSTPTTGTVDTAYITASFGTSAVFLQDATGGIYVYYGANANSSLMGLSVGTQVTGFTSAAGGFEYSATYNEFEYYPGSKTGAITTTGSTAGTPSSIPANYFTATTVNGILTNQGSYTAGPPTAVVQGLQNQLVTLDNVTIQTSTGTAPAAGATFVAGAYRIVDSSSTSYLTLYINSTDTDVIGTAIPTGAENVTGVFDEYSKTQQEIEPRGLYDLTAGTTAVPEPSTYLGGAFAIAVGAVTLRRRRHA